MSEAPGGLPDLAQSVTRAVRLFFLGTVCSNQRRSTDVYGTIIAFVRVQSSSPTNEKA